MADVSSVISPQSGVVLGVPIDFLATPDAVKSDIALIRGTLMPSMSVPLHSHADPEVIYVLDGAIEVYQESPERSKWETAQQGDTIILPGGVKHALRNSFSSPVITLAVTQKELYGFFQELLVPVSQGVPPGKPGPKQMEALFVAASRHGYWLAGPAENEAIGIYLPG